MFKPLRAAAIALAAALLPTALSAATTQPMSLTPTPYEMTTGAGAGLRLTNGFTVGGNNLPADMATELDKFVEAVNKASGLGGRVAASASGATITVAQSRDAALGDEGYTLSVSPSGATITARTPAGLYYAFQTVKKLLPFNVMVETPDAKVTEYVIPAVEITDHPTFSHRGFELDCARHFHSLDEIKRMLDIMSYYKMNRFHWHLTDDQGWRVEIEKYPRLLTVGSIAPDAYLCDFDTRTSYLLGQPYGPFYYTKDQLREIVAYAAERHIEVFPEIDMPGHMVAAIAAYPEFSCNPAGDHTIWFKPGVSTDVLNVANPAVIQFCKDVISELAEVFPYKLFHIGGDETPATAWEKNAECQELMKREGFTNVRQLQSWFTKQIADHIKSLGKQPVGWNEVITASGADLALAKDAGILVYDWLGGGTSKAHELGLQAVYCNTGVNYLDYPQGSDNEPKSMGSVIGLPKVYNSYPEVQYEGTVIGVQGNLWTEYISDPKHVEYNALPRLIAIAENGWSPREKKDFEDFQARISADTTMWNYRGYTYGRHHLLTPGAQTGMVLPDPETWVTLTTRATNRSRQGRVVELVAENSPLIQTNGATAGLLWAGTVSTAPSDWQMWRFIPDPDNAKRFALVCKAKPQGSVAPDPGSSSTDARWSYDDNARHYNFVLGENDYYGKADGAYYYSIRSDRGDGFWLNCGVDGGDTPNPINCWNNPADGNGGLWLVADPNDSSIELPDPNTWMTVATRATGGERAGRVLELVADGSHLIADHGATAGLLWSGPADGSDWQQWRFIPDPDNADRFALVCKAAPEGSVAPDPGSTSTAARWNYDFSARHYNFILGEHYGTVDNKTYYSIRSDINAGYWLNCGTNNSREKLTINCWSDPADGFGGHWFVYAPKPITVHPAFAPLAEGKSYIFTNAAERFSGAMLADIDGTVLSSLPTDPVAWTVATASAPAADNSQTITLVNAATGRAIEAVGNKLPSPNFDGYNGKAITLGSNPAALTIYRNTDTPDFTIAINGEGLTANGTAVAAGGSKAVMPSAVGGAWIPAEVTLVAISCADEAGASIGNFTYALPSGATIDPEAMPAIEGYTFRSSTTGADGSVKAVYALTSRKMTYECRTADGFLIAVKEVSIPVGTELKVALPEIPFFTAQSSVPAAGTVMPEGTPAVIKAVYTTEAHLGADGHEAELNSLDELPDGTRVLIYNDHATRYSYCTADITSGKVVGNQSTTVAPYSIWTIERGQSASSVAFRNPFTGKYITALAQGTPVALSDTPEYFTIARHSNGNGWQITNGIHYWDTDGSLNLQGWGAPGHNFHFFVPVAAPYFTLTIEEVDAATGKQLASTSTLLRAGSSYIFVPRDREGYDNVAVEGADNLHNIGTHTLVTVKYSNGPASIDAIGADSDSHAPRGTYDLSGRRIKSAGEALAPGVYIIDGRKTLVR